MSEGGASIQGDKEYVRIHHRILEQLALAPLTGGELRCLLWLLRKTYGWNKKEDKISLSQWAEGVGMKRQNIWNILQTLIQRNIIYMKSNGPKRAAIWGFNKYYENWMLESVMPQHDKSVIPDDDKIEESVMPEHDSCENAVMPQHDKSVIPPHERTKDNKDSSSRAAAAALHPIQLFVNAYEKTWGLMVASDYIRERIDDWEKRVTYDGWVYALKECVNTRNIGKWGYLERILERLERDGYQAKSNIATAPDVLDFSLKEYL